MNSFKELGIEDSILSALGNLGFREPMPVQAEVIPHLIKNADKDIIGLAQTGTGKTAAFGIPLIQNIDSSQKKIQHLILSPTRELCLQITEDLNSFARFKDHVKITPVFGGSSIDQQIKAIRKGTQIISATPGRLLDLIKRRKVDLSGIKTVVLDEADEMLNMGFREDLEAILDQTPVKKNMLLFSATMPKEVQEIAKRFMENPLEIIIGKRNAGAENVIHQCYMVQASDKYLALKRIVDYHPEIYGIVFCRTRLETQEVANKLLQDGYNADALHGDLSQAQRDTVMNKFRIGHLQLLIATDVAARGLDVNNLTHIINYSLPDDPQVYTHRSGRTGRAGRTGTSIVIANLREKSRLRLIEKQIKKQFEYPPIPSGHDICEKQMFYHIDRVENADVDHTQIDSFLPEIYRKLELLNREELIKKFVALEFSRVLDYYKKTPELKRPSDSKKSSKRRDIHNSYARFFINLGKRDRLNPTMLIGMINEFTQVRNIPVGEIDIRDTYSFFEIEEVHSGILLEAFENKNHGKQKISLEPAEPKTVKNRRSGENRRFRQKSNRAFKQEKKKSDRKKEMWYSKY